MENTHSRHQERRHRDVKGIAKSSYFVLVGFCFLVTVCAPGPRGLDDPKVHSKLDARLRMALSGEGVVKQTGDWLRVIVRLEGSVDPAHREWLEKIGRIGSARGSIATLTLRKDRLVPLARDERVVFIELESVNVPAPEDPPALQGEGP